jgi:trigger factor
VGSNEIIEGIDEALIGASEGESRTFTTTLVAGEYADREAEVTATVGSVKLRELPELDDDFAQLASEFDTLDELKGNLRERLGGVKVMRQGSQARDKVLELLAQAVEVPLPDSLIEAEFRARKHDAQHVLDHDEQRMQDWLQEQGQTEEEFDTELRKSAAEVVKMRLMLDAISDAHDVTVDDTELSERIIMQAQRLGVSPQDYIAQVQESGELGALYNELRRAKALAVVVRQTTVTDTAGNPVDLSALFGEPESEAEDAAESAADAGDEAGDEAGEPGAAPLGEAAAETGDAAAAEDDKTAKAGE